ncbi:MAG TPA: serine hydrolase domain-containing protein, partial [Cyclobacteriaceae bacterium]
MIIFLQTNCQQSTKPSTVITPAPPPGVTSLNSFLEEVQTRYGLPGIAAVVFNSDSIIAVGAAGTRKMKSGVPLIYTDKFQIASIAKTMTATIVARLIEDGLLSWENSLADLYPELARQMQPAYRTVTLEMLMHHSGGLPRWMRNDEVVKSWGRKHNKLSTTEKRYEAVKYILMQSPEYPPGTREYYTNDSYLIIGNICERVSRRSCEELFQDYIFNPLKMSSSGFGEPWIDGTTNNPWGHEKRGNQFVPYDPDPVGYGKIPFGTPYGAIVHGSVIDLAKYGIFHLRGDLGLENSLSQSTFQRLHHANPTHLPPATQLSANGFFNEGRVDSAGRWTNVQHWGYYARGRTLFWFSPQANIGAVILTNGTEENETEGMKPIS